MQDDGIDEIAPSNGHNVCCHHYIQLSHDQPTQRVSPSALSQKHHGDEVAVSGYIKTAIET